MADMSNAFQFRVQQSCPNSILTAPLPRLAKALRMGRVTECQSNLLAASIKVRLLFRTRLAQWRAVCVWVLFFAKTYQCIDLNYLT